MAATLWCPDSWSAAILCCPNSVRAHARHQVIHPVPARRTALGLQELSPCLLAHADEVPTKRETTEQQASERSHQEVLRHSGRQNRRHHHLLALGSGPGLRL